MVVQIYDNPLQKKKYWTIYLKIDYYDKFYIMDILPL